jgi:hypothetical protein
MNDGLCVRVRHDLDAFVDGELGGAHRLLVADHLASCAECAQEEHAIRSLGDRLRSALPAATAPQLAGLAGGVTSRVRAEQAQSWPATLQRGLEDWHWVLVGAGSLASGCLSVAFLSALLWFGGSPPRDDSLEALLNNLVTPAGTLIMLASPVGSNRDSMVMQFDPTAMGPESGGPVVVPNGFSGPSELDLVRALADTMVTHDGRMSDLRAMSQPERKRAEALLDEIQRVRDVAPTPWSGSQVSVRQLGLVTNIVCTGKALAP